MSRRVIVRQHATTWEGRRLIHAVVTSPENHSRLESIRENNLRMFDSAGGISDKDLGTMPGIVYLGYSIHGNEASGSEAAVLTLYHLAAGQGREIRDLLEHNVILIDPMLNPDGRDRFVDWANGNRSNVITSDGQDREQRAVAGRTHQSLLVRSQPRLAPRGTPGVKRKNSALPSLAASASTRFSRTGERRQILPHAGHSEPQQS